jgi:signal transduction histidine kinase
LKQVVLNLLSNAAEAMPNGGRLTVVSADNVNLDGELFVLLQVTDSAEASSRRFCSAFSSPARVQRVRATKVSVLP